MVKTQIFHSVWWKPSKSDHSPIGTRIERLPVPSFISDLGFCDKLGISLLMPKQTCRSSYTSKLKCGWNLLPGLKARGLNPVFHHVRSLSCSVAVPGNVGGLCGVPCGRPNFQGADSTTLSRDLHSRGLCPQNLPRSCVEQREHEMGSCSVPPGLPSTLAGNSGILVQRTDQGKGKASGGSPQNKESFRVFCVILGVLGRSWRCLTPPLCPCFIQGWRQQALSHPLHRTPGLSWVSGRTKAPC